MSFEDKVFYGACGIGAVGWTLDAIHLVDRKSIGIVGEHIGNFNPVMGTIMMAGATVYLQRNILIVNILN